MHTKIERYVTDKYRARGIFGDMNKEYRLVNAFTLHRRVMYVLLNKYLVKASTTPHSYQPWSRGAILIQQTGFYFVNRRMNKLSIVPSYEIVQPRGGQSQIRDNTCIPIRSDGTTSSHNIKEDGNAK
jgi:hypothetical protein